MKKGGLYIDSVSFSYKDHPVIKDISIFLPFGKRYGILGPNGSGKSTFMDLISGHLKPDKGTVYYDGSSISELGKRKMAKRIAIVPQNFYINFPFTAKEVVMMGRYPHMPRFASPGTEDEDIVSRTMKDTKTDEFKDRYVNELSSGERQRVVFARALAQNTPVLILDEATSNLDIRHSLMLLDLATRRHEKRHTTLSVFQDINLSAMYCDHLIFMTSGRIVTSGTIAEVFNPKTLKEVFGVEAQTGYDSFSRSLRASFKRKGVAN